VLGTSSVLVLIVVSESASLCWILFTSLLEVLAPGSLKGELLKSITLSFLDLSEDDSEPVRIRLSCDRWQTIRPLFQLGKEKDDDTLSCRNEKAAFAMGKSCVIELCSIRPLLFNGEYIKANHKTVSLMQCN
jgi:hypothetical protein